MGSFFRVAFFLVAILGTICSAAAVKEAAWVWEETLWLRYFNFFLVAPLWFVAVFLARPSAKHAVLKSVVVALAIAAGLSLFQAGLYHVQTSSGRKAACMNTLKQIGLALQQYETCYGCLPPAVVSDAKGKPMHSWRVLVLRFIDEDLYRQYSFNEPWDGPNNRGLADKIGGIYHCPSDPESPSNTSYVAVVGPGTAWPTKGSIKTSDTRDSPNKAICVVEMADSGINCMEPRDLNFAQMDFHVNGESRNSISSCHTGSANVITADCRVFFLRDTAPPETVRALLTTAGDETVSPDDLK
jgi:hypothetical protein